MRRPSISHALPSLCRPPRSQPQGRPAKPMRRGALAYALLYCSTWQSRQRAATIGLRSPPPVGVWAAGLLPPGLPFFLPARTHCPKGGTPGAANWGRSPPLLGIQEQRVFRLLFFLPSRSAPPAPPLSLPGVSGNLMLVVPPLLRGGIGSVDHGRLFLTCQHDAVERCRRATDPIDRHIVGRHVDCRDLHNHGANIDGTGSG